MDTPWIPPQLTPVQLEERRLQAAVWFREGQLTQTEIAHRLGVSPAAVSQWRARWRHGGDRQLRARPRRGQAGRLSEAQWHRLLRVLHRGARAAGFETEQWTLKRIAQMIQRQFGVRYHPRYLERPLHAHGWSAHRPAPRAKERDDAVVAAWLKRDWPALKKELTARGARLPAWTRRVTRFGPA
jgi:putative transposase